MKFILVAGFYATGSSAVVDLLRECSNTYVCPGEFRLISDPYGIRMLEDSLVEHWTPIRATAAISDFLDFARKSSRKRSRFPFSPFGLGYADNIHADFMGITQRYVESLCSDVYYQDYYFNKAKKDYLTYVVDRWRLGVQHYSKNRINIVHKYRCYCSKPSREAFYVATRKYFDDLFSNVAGKKYVVLDQGVHPCDADVVDKYFDEAKMIIIDRDLRDVYISSVEHHGVFESDAASYIQRQATIRENIYESPNVLRIRFEDMIRDYENYITMIMDFCGIDYVNHVKPKKYFNPERSKKNIGIWKKYYEKYPQVMDAISEYIKRGTSHA